MQPTQTHERTHRTSIKIKLRPLWSQLYFMQRRDKILVKCCVATLQPGRLGLRAFTSLNNLESVCTNNHRDEFSFKTVTVVLVFMQFAVFCYHRVIKHIKTVTVVKCSKGKNTPRAPNLSYHKHHQTHLIIYTRKAGQIAGFCLYR